MLGDSRMFWTTVQLERPLYVTSSRLTPSHDKPIASLSFSARYSCANTAHLCFQIRTVRAAEVVTHIQYSRRCQKVAIILDSVMESHFILFHLKLKYSSFRFLIYKTWVVMHLQKYSRT